MIRVEQDGSGDFMTISEALESIQQINQQNPNALQPVTIQIGSGHFRERLHIRHPHITLIGASAEETILTYDLYATMYHEDIGKLGTFRSYSTLIDTHDITAINLTFENSAGSGAEVGQALALYADGDRLAFYGCRFLGGQDTLFTAPLPPAEVEPNGFIGPKQHTSRINGRHYYKDCYLEGDIDFVFGGATAYFDNCQFHSKNLGRDINSYVSAASTPCGQSYGYVMNHCRFTGDCPTHSAYLGRPWREYARTVLINCFIDSHICEEGWHDWNKKEAHDTVFYAEYGSSGPSSDHTKRPSWVTLLTQAEACQYEKQTVLSGTDGWNPEAKTIYL